MNLENWVRRFEGHPVYIIGSSARIDELPNDFCAGKLSIGLNESFLRFERVGPLPTFIHVCEQAVHDWIYGGEDDEARHRLIPTDPLYGEEDRRPPLLDCLPFRPGGFDRPGVARECVEKAMQGDTRYRYTAHGTCLHTAVFIALILGASRIYTAGCGDHDRYCAAVSVMKHITQQIPPERQAEQRNRQKRGTEILKSICAEKGVLWEEL